MLIQPDGFLCMMIALMPMLWLTNMVWYGICDFQCMTFSSRSS